MWRSRFDADESYGVAVEPANGGMFFRLMGLSAFPYGQKLEVFFRICLIRFVSTRRLRLRSLVFSASVIVLPMLIFTSGIS
jgi:hypothetical protein